MMALESDEETALLQPVAAGKRRRVVGVILALALLVGVTVGTLGATQNTYGRDVADVDQSV